MSIEAGNTPSGTDGLSEAEAVSQLTGLLSADSADETSEVENDADDVSEPFEDEEESTEEQPLEDSDEDDTTDEDAEDAEADSDGAYDDNFEIEVNGEKLPLGELKKGYLRQADYTRKTQELSESTKGFESQKARLLEGVRGELTNRLQQYDAVVRALVLPQEPDWAELARDNPAEYVAAKEEWDSKQRGIAAIQNELKGLQQQQTAHQQAAHRKMQDEGRNVLMEMHPELASTEMLPGEKITKGQKEVLGLWEYGVEKFGKEAIESIADPKMFDVLRKAQLYDRMKSQSGKVKAVTSSKPSLAKPGTAGARASSNKDDKQKAFARLKRTGSDQDAIAILAQSLK